MRPVQNYDEWLPTLRALVGVVRRRMQLRRRICGHVVSCVLKVLAVVQMARKRLLLEQCKELKVGHVKHVSTYIRQRMQCSEDGVALSRPVARFSSASREWRSDGVTLL